MTATLIDTNVLVDVIESRPVWGEWAARQLELLSMEGDLIINQIVYAEASFDYQRSTAFPNLFPRS
jgi:predicted nucleic acid-binding protein